MTTDVIKKLALDGDKIAIKIIVEQRTQAVNLLKDLSDTVKAIDGTSVENEKLVDRYNALMNALL